MLIPNLLDDIARNILSRLPVKSLLRFRSVSKRWHSLISSDPHFITLHLNRSILSNRQRVLLSTSPLQSIDYESSFHDVIDVDDAVVDLDCPLWEPNFHINILGSCNGLVCLFLEQCYIILYNPSTRVFKELPQQPNPHSQTASFYGFGYDSSMDDYKVVSGPLSVGASDGIRFDLFSLKHNSWRSTQHLGHSISFPAVGAFLNGALHWLATRGLGSDKVNVIISFDLAEEVFREMPQPDLDHLRKSVHILGVLGGWLCVFNDGNASFVEIWVMNEYGVKASWSKLITVPRGIGIRSFYHPLCFLRNGELLLAIGGLELMMYNPKEKILRKVSTRDDGNVFAAVMYVESLVSPNGVDGNDKEEEQAQGDITENEV